MIIFKCFTIKLLPYFNSSIIILIRNMYGFTIINILFAGILFIGNLMNKPLLKLLLGETLKLQDAGWSILTIRWISFFIVLAILNEIIWRTQSTDIWVSFKVFGILPLTFIFTLVQIPVIKKFQIED